MQLLTAQAKKDEASLKAAKLGYLPSLSFNPTYSIDNALGSSFSIPVSASWQLDIFGSNTSRKRQAAALTAQARDLEQATRAKLVSSIAQLYLQLVTYDRQFAIMLHARDLWEQSLETQKALMENGRAYSTAVNQMEASVLSVDLQIVELKNSITQCENAICQMLAETPHHIARSEWVNPYLPDKIALGVPADMLRYRPDVRAAEHNLESAFFGVNFARSEFFPKISIGGSLAWGGGSSLIAGAVASLLQPIFAQGQLNANLKISKYRMEDAQNRFVQAVIDAGNEVNSALSEYHSALAKKELYSRQVAALEDAFYATRELMDNGKAIYLEVLTAQESYLNAQISEVINLYAANYALIELYTALGGATEWDQ